jgi:hypothetical protein
MTATTRRRLEDVAIVAAPFVALIVLGVSLPLFAVMIVAGAIVGARNGRFEAVWLGSVAAGAFTGVVAAIAFSGRVSDIAIGAIVGALGAIAFVTPGFLFGRAFRAVVGGPGAARAALLVAAGIGVLIAGVFLAALVFVILARPAGP